MVDAKEAKKCQKFRCEKCDFLTSKKSNWLKHIETQKHKMLTNDDMDNKYDYKCFCGKEFKYRQSLHRHKKHCESENHKTIAKMDKKWIKMDKCPKMSKNENLFECECGKLYKYQSGLSKHKQKCNLKSSDLSIVKDDSDLKTMFMSIMEQNKELMEKCTELASKPTTNITNNTQFNVMNYLNTECADAMNLSDFINDFQFSLKDMEILGTKGYQEAMEQTFVKQLFDMDKTKRPIHCSDKKRKSFYIRDNDVWVKDNNNEKLILNMKNLSNVHNRAISKWQRCNNDWLDNDRKHDFYLKYVFEFTKCGHEKERNKIINKLSDLSLR